MATSLTGVGAVWASLSLLAAVLCCSGFYLPFWIQLPMNEGRQNDERNGRKESQEKFEKILRSAIINEKIVEDNPNEERNGNAQPVTENEIPGLYLKEDEKTEEGQTTSLETLLAAWWNYKRANKLKKKKKKTLKIYRDENYWSHDRFTDDEDFNYSEP